MTLLELLISLAIVAILATIAVPHYQDWLLYSHRSLAKTQLLQAANELERYHAMHQQYLGAETLKLQSEMPNTFYKISVKEITTKHYILWAQAIGTQKNDLDCMDFLLDESSRKYSTGLKSSSECWQF